MPEDDLDVSRLLMLLWINFAKYGDPTPPIVDNHDFYWTPATAQTFPLYANISGITPTMVENSEDYNRRMDFWAQLLHTY